MADTGDRQKIVAGISDQQVLALEQAAIRIPSTTFEEGKLADHFGNYMSSAPGFCIMLTVVAVNLFGDALRDELDPRLRSLANL
jgi:hypothetical protein